MFNQESATTILEQAMEISYDIKRLSKWLGKHIWSEHLTRRLIEKTHEIFELDIFKLEILTSTNYNLDEIIDTKLKKELRTLCGMVSSLGDWFPSIQFNMKNLKLKEFKLFLILHIV